MCERFLTDSRRRSYAADVPVVAADEIACVPEEAAVFVLRLGEAEPYVGRTKRLRSRVEKLLSPAEGKRLSLAGRVTAVEWTPAYSEFEARWMQYATLRREFPETYRRKMRLRMPPMIRIGWSNPYPRAWVTRKVGEKNRSSAWGPFRSRREAEEALHALQGLFKVRRCWEDLQPSVEHPGCIYGEMKLCAAPCQLRVAAQEYAAEVRRLEQFLETGGANLLEPLAAERERATEMLEFERAAALHEEYQAVRTAAANVPEFVRRLDRWTGLVMQKGSCVHRVRVFPVQDGALTYAGEADLEQAHKAGLREVADAIHTLVSGRQTVSGEGREAFVLLNRWLYKSPDKREGELVLADRDGVISSRRIANATMRLIHPNGTAGIDVSNAGT